MLNTIVLMVLIVLGYALMITVLPTALQIQTFI